jgi:nucleotide-binding universal stress UspA family protein
MTDFVAPVLVGIDGTPSGLEALALGSAVAILTGAPLVLTAVYGYHGNAEVVWPPKSTADAWVREAGHRVSPLLSWSARVVLSSSPARGLVTRAKLEQARMIVVGSSHRGPVGRVLVGSTGRHVAHGAPCAVAIAPRDWQTQPPDAPVTFGVGVNDTPEARQALALAASLAEAAHAPLKVIEVVDGDPVERLVEASHGFDMLVVGSRRYGALRSGLLGSVSAPLIERAACPVVIVPRGVDAESGHQVDAEHPVRA